MTAFKGRHFEKDIIIVAVTYYLRYNLSHCDISEILLKRGVSVHHTTIYRWVQKYAKILYSEWKKNKYSVSDSWRMDETYIKVKGQCKYLYRAIDKTEKFSQKNQHYKIYRVKNTIKSINPSSFKEAFLIFSTNGVIDSFI